MKKKNFKRYFNISLTIFGGLALSILFFFLLFYIPAISSGVSTIIDALKPLIYGGVIAYLLYPICLFFEKYIGKCFEKMKDRQCAFRLTRGLSIFFSFVVGLAIIYIILALIVPQIYESILKIINNAPDYINKIVDFVKQTLSDNKALQNNVNQVITEYTGDLTNLLSNIGSRMGDVVQGISSGVIGVVIATKNLFIGIIIAVYLLISRGSFKSCTKRFIDLIFNNKWAKEIKEELHFSNKVVGNFISGRILDSAIIGLLCYIVMMIIGLPYPVLISVLVGVTNIIPFFGPFIGGIPAGLLILIESPIQCLYFAIFIIILQQFDGNILGPSIIGDSMGLSSFWVLFSMLLFGGVFGLAGLIIGVPLFAIIYDVVKKIILRAEAKKLEKNLTKLE